MIDSENSPNPCASLPLIAAWEALQMAAADVLEAIRKEEAGADPCEELDRAAERAGKVRVELRQMLSGKRRRA